MHGGEAGPAHPGCLASDPRASLITEPLAGHGPARARGWIVAGPLFLATPRNARAKTAQRSPSDPVGLPSDPERKGRTSARDLPDF